MGTFEERVKVVAGSAIVGTVGIDQTTPGTTNGVQLVMASLTMTHAAVATNNTTSVTALAARGSGSFALFVNDAANAIYLHVDGSDSVANTGIRLNANGGSYEMSAAAGNLSLAKCTAISAAGTGQNLLVTSG